LKHAGYFKTPLSPRQRQQQFGKADKLENTSAAAAAID
jgi:hypothetical protein